MTKNLKMNHKLSLIEAFEILNRHGEIYKKIKDKILCYRINSITNIFEYGYLGDDDCYYNKSQMSITEFYKMKWYKEIEKISKYEKITTELAVNIISNSSCPIYYDKNSSYPIEDKSMIWISDNNIKTYDCNGKEKNAGINLNTFLCVKQWYRKIQC